MGKTTFIKGVRKLSEENTDNGKEKVEVRYMNENDSSDKLSTRAVYKDEQSDYKFKFKGVIFKVVFDEDIASKVDPVEIYDNKIIKENPDKMDDFDISLKAESFVSVKNDEEEKKEKPVKKSIDKDKIVKHHKFNEIKACVEAEVPVYLHGPAGSGKNHTLKQIAEELELEFYFTNSVQQEYKLTGFIDAGGKYHETEFYKAFKDGGLFFLDEMDASIPEVLVLLNAALANGYFEFPNGKIYAHEDFRVVSAGNTVGAGADEEYAGRLELDQATLDRFAMIEFDYDKDIEFVIAKGNKELVDFIRGLRKEAENKGISAVFSYRSITMVTKLEGKLDLKEIVKIAVVKGLDEDTINTFATTPENKYSKALWQLKQAG